MLPRHNHCSFKLWFVFRHQARLPDLPVSSPNHPLTCNSVGTFSSWRRSDVYRCTLSRPALMPRVWLITDQFRSTCFFLFAYRQEHRSRVHGDMAIFCFWPGTAYEIIWSALDVLNPSSALAGNITDGTCRIFVTEVSLLSLFIK